MKLLVFITICLVSSFIFFDLFLKKNFSYRHIAVVQLGCAQSVWRRRRRLWPWRHRHHPTSSSIPTLDAPRSRRHRRRYELCGQPYLSRLAILIVSHGDFGLLFRFISSEMSVSSCCSSLSSLCCYHLTPCDVVILMITKYEATVNKAIWWCFEYVLIKTKNWWRIW